MENIYRFKKRMVYPEMLNLDQVATVNNKQTTNNSSSWCSIPLEKHTEDRVTSANYANRHFIQDRIRHLVEAFSTRTQATRERIEAPATPSSISSHETIDQTAAISVKQRINSIDLTDNDDDDDNDVGDKHEDYGILNKHTIKQSRNKCLQSIKYLWNNQVIDPNGKFYIVWMSIAALTVLYNVWVIPLRSTFPYQTLENRAIWMLFDYIADFVYFLDVLCVQPRVKYLSEGFWVTDMAALRYNYIKTNQFKFDIISLIPLDVLYVIFGPEFVILRLPRFLKLHTFFNFFNFIDKLLANPYIIRLTRTLMYMMYLIHLNACAYYAFSAWQGIGSNNFVYNGKGNAYIKCFYFATKTATSIGKNPRPTQESEYMFMTLSWLMGVFVFALLIGQIRDIISTATRSKTEYRKLVDETLEYMRRLNLPQDMQRRVQLWFNYTWETQHTLDENTIMDCLPHKMKTDIAINVHIQTLSKVKLFADCDEALLRELVLQLKSVIYLPGDIICKKGDVGKEMYIIQSGQVQVIGGHADYEQVLATLSEGSVFGEISLLGIPGMNRRTADVRSKGYSNLFVLSKADLNAALSHYPEAQELLNKKAKILMKKNAALERQLNNKKHNNNKANNNQNDDEDCDVENDKKAIIIIDNPTPPPKQAKLLDTVLQVLPPDSKTNRLLRYGSRGKPPLKTANDRFKYRNSLPGKFDYDSMDSAIETKATVHRTMS